MMKLIAKNWKNKRGTGDRSCKCGNWKKHWENYSNKPWPNECSVSHCHNSATLGAHVINSNIDGERIMPSCDSCNQLSSEFSLKGGVTLVKSNQLETCNQK